MLFDTTVYGKNGQARLTKTVTIKDYRIGVSRIQVSARKITAYSLTALLAFTHNVFNQKAIAKSKW
ncbi:hypothetical protein [uncultured Alteromonas sp.]|jgi:hypothetical protein|uniref:hypothetical protein n=1 Tax=uncultured Alteromonas sp. TaxID=179113 RepID=UPI0030CBDDEA|tara:strand:- start:12216 stop:12413 length:198 start_codon:yes stop_codon:yes gene_type:complete